MYLSDAIKLIFLDTSLLTNEYVHVSQVGLPLAQAPAISNISLPISVLIIISIFLRVASPRFYSIYFISYIPLINIFIAELTSLSIFTVHFLFLQLYTLFPLISYICVHLLHVLLVYISFTIRQHF